MKTSSSKTLVIAGFLFCDGGGEHLIQPKSLRLMFSRDNDSLWPYWEHSLGFFFYMGLKEVSLDIWTYLASRMKMMV